MIGFVVLTWQLHLVAQFGYLAEPPARHPGLAAIRQAQQRRGDALRSYQVRERYLMTLVPERPFQPTHESRSWRSGMKLRHETAHFSPFCLDFNQARERDPFCNTVVADGVKQTVFQNFRRWAAVIPDAFKESAELRLDNLVLRHFLPTARESARLDQAILFKSASGKLVAIKEREIWLPTALDDHAWRLETHVAAQIPDAPRDWKYQNRQDLIRLRRDSGRSWTDDMIFDPRRDHALVYRALRFEPGDALEHFYDDLDAFGPHAVLARTIQWKRPGKHVIVELLELAIGPVDPGNWEIDFPEGTVIEDQVAKNQRTIPGGEYALLDFVNFLRRIDPVLAQPAKDWHLPLGYRLGRTGRWGLLAGLGGLVVGVVAGTIQRRRQGRSS